MEKRINRKFTVCIGDRSATVLTETEDEAVEKAVKKMYGKSCFWFSNSGLPGYGQVFKSLSPTKYNTNPGNTSVTYRVRIDVYVSEKSRKFLKQEKQDSDDQKAANEYWEGFNSVIDDDAAETEQDKIIISDAAQERIEKHNAHKCADNHGSYKYNTNIVYYDTASEYVDGYDISNWRGIEEDGIGKCKLLDGGDMGIDVLDTEAIITKNGVDYCYINAGEDDISFIAVDALRVTLYYPIVDGQAISLYSSEAKAQSVYDEYTK